MADVGSQAGSPPLAPGFRTTGGVSLALAGFHRGLMRCALAERDRWGLWVPVLLAIGIVGYFSLHREPPLWIGAVGVTAAATALIALRTLRQSVGSAAPFVAVIFGLLALGFAAAQVQTALVTTKTLEEQVGPVALTGVVRRIEPLPNGARVVLTDVRSRDERREIPGTVRVRLRGDLPPMAPGDRVRLAAVLSPPPAPVIPGGYDFQREAYFVGLGAIGFAVGPVSVVSAVTAGGTAVETWFARLRHAVSQEVRRVVAPPTSAVVIALLVGEQRAIPEPQMAAIRDSGLAHLLSISGLHIGLVAMLVMLALRSALALIPPLALRYPIKKWAACGSVVAAGFYTLLAGAPVPSQRAFLMVLLVLLAVLVDRRTTPMRLVAIAAVVLCLTQPHTILGPSFQMSFFAVMALIAMYEWTRSQPSWFSPRAEQWRPLIYLVGLTLSSLVATLATAPFVTFHFNRLAVFGLFANLVAVPLTSVWIMPWAIVALLLMPFGLSALALYPMAWGVDIVIWVAEVVAGWPGAVAQLPPMPPWALAALAFGLLWLCLWRQRWRLMGLVPVAAGVVATLVSAPPDLLIDGTGKLVAVRAADGGLMLSSIRASSMARETWLRAGERADSVAAFPVTGSSADGRLTCDGAGCIWRHAGHLIAIARSGEALAEDCRRADAIVSVVPVRRRCPAPSVVIDRFDLWREGAHALWVRPDGMRMASVNALRGERPWVPSRQPRSGARRNAADPPGEDSGEDVPSE